MTENQLARRYEADQIARRVAEIASTLCKEFPDGDLVLISILKGSSFFLGDLARRMTVPVACEFISVRRGQADHVLQIDFRTEFDTRGRPAILLKDVVSTGVIENYLIGHLRSQGASRVRLAAIVDRTDQRTTDVVVDYALFTVPGGHFAGYGMEYQGKHAQLPYIAEISGPSGGAAAGQ
jgi:hypoxanthine phosphoribosyltransferase